MVIFKVSNICCSFERSLSLFWLFFRFRVILVIFRSFVGILVILKVWGGGGVLWSFCWFWGRFGYFLGLWDILDLRGAF